MRNGLGHTPQETGQYDPHHSPSEIYQLTNRNLSITHVLPSGKHTKNYGKSPFLMGKSTINGNFQ